MTAGGSPTDILERLAALERLVERIDMSLQTVLSLPTIKHLLNASVTGVNEIAGAVGNEWEDPGDHGESFTYDPLDASRKEIRLLSLRAQSDLKTPVKCKLQNVSIKDDPAGLAVVGGARMGGIIRGPNDYLNYDALSYTWGDVEDKVSITVNGRELKITRNLEAALRHMRKHKFEEGGMFYAESCYWWIDAICINQDDIDERNSQVSLMTEIFSKANTVHVWLGQEDDDSTMAMSLASQLSTFIHIGPGEKPEEYPQKSPEDKSRHWGALISIFQRPWWERVWVRQEVALGATVTVHWGRLTCGWDDLVRVAQMLSYLTDHLQFDPSAVDKTGRKNLFPAISGGISCFRRAILLDELRDASGPSMSKQFVDLKDLIFHTRGCKATEVRDKAYAILGMADPEIYNLTPNYHSPVNQVYRDVALALMPHTLDFLSGCQNPERLNGLPSWVPNLLDDWKAFPFPSEDNYEAPKAHYDEASGVLSVTGLLVETLESTSEDTAGHGATHEEMAQLKKKWQKFAMSVVETEERNRAHDWADEQWQQSILRGIDRISKHRPVKYRPQAPHGRGRTVDDDPQIRMLKSLLLPDGYTVRDRDDDTVEEYINFYGIGRRLGVTRRGLVGLVPADARPEDVVCILPGASFPHILRRQGSGFVEVGEAYEIPCDNFDPDYLEEGQEFLVFDLI